MTMRALFDIQPLLNHLVPGNLILTPNQRLASKILQAHEQHQLQNTDFWLTPQVLALDTWMKQSWLELLDSAHPMGHHTLLLSPAQEHCVWQDIIENNPLDIPLLRPHATAEVIQQAYKNCQLWALNFDTEEFDGTTESQFFRDAAQQFQIHCQNNGQLSQTDLPAILSDAFNQHLLPPLNNIILVGFDAIAPQHQTLLNSATDSLFEHPIPPQDAQPIKLAVASADQEIIQAAHWCRNLLENEDNPRIGLIVENLAQHRQAIENVLVRLLQPHYLTPGTARYVQPFNFSAGRPLDQAPVIQHGLRLLKLIAGHAEFNDAINLLRSPFTLHDPQEIDLRSIAEQQLRRFPSPEITLSQLRLALEYAETKLGRSTTKPLETPENPAPSDTGTETATCCEAQSLSQRLLQLGTQLREQKSLHQKQRPSQWANQIITWLEQLGWPGGRRLDSVEYQQITTWYESLEQLGQLDPIQGNISLTQFIETLNRHTQKTAFQAKTNDSPIQILGTLEAAGLSFTHVWLTGFNNKNWPPSPAPNPFIPISLQIKNNLPRASSERELLIAQSISYKLSHSAPHVIASYYLMDDDVPCDCSPLFSDFEEAGESFTINTTPINTTTINTTPINPQKESSSTLEHYSDELAPAVPPNSAIRGGAGVLKNQAACPSRAFAIHRLHANRLEIPGVGLSKQLRGILLHAIMASIWNQLQTSEALAQQNDEQLNALIHESIQHNILHLKKQAPNSLGERFWDIEQQRLFEQVALWFQHERQRPPFEVLAHEKATAINIAGLELNLIIDRIDRAFHPDKNGEQLILVDYKTGHPSLAQWESERPDDPQLPLYTLALEPEPDQPDSLKSDQENASVAAIAFGQINVENSTLQGVGESGLNIDGITTHDKIRKTQFESWQQAKTFWREQLTHLAQEFAQGIARVDPKGNTTCTYCNLQSFCRINDSISSTKDEGSAYS